MASSFAPRATSILILVTVMTSSLFYRGQSSAPAAAPMMPVSPGPASGPAAAQDCFSLLLGMADCLDYVVEGSNSTKPSKACCPELKTLVDTNPICLCDLLANASSFGYDIDFNRATKLPSVCKVDTPPLTTCSLLGYPVGGPTASAAPAPSEGPTAGAFSTAGSSVAPSPSGNIAGRASFSFASIFVVAVVGFSIFF